MIRIKRVYDDPEDNDGKRYLVDRLWPRGIKKEDLTIEDWVKEAAPSSDLRKWFGHDAQKWTEFAKAYQEELEKNDAWTPIAEAAREGDVTLLYSARDRDHNQAVVLKSFLEKKIK